MSAYMNSSFSSTKANNVRTTCYQIKKTEPVDYEFLIKIPNMTLSPEISVGRALKLRFATQSSLSDTIIESDEVIPDSDSGTEVQFYTSAKITTIMSMNAGSPMEKF